MQIKTCAQAVATQETQIRRAFKTRFLYTMRASEDVKARGRGGGG